MKANSTKDRGKRIITIVLIVVIAVITIIGIYRYQKITLLDKTEYNNLIDSLELDSTQITSQDQACDYIVSWAKSHKLDCTVDESKNIILNRAASKTKKNIAPTVTVVNYNYENIYDARRVLSAAAMVASTDLNSGQNTVIFVNNEMNDGQSYLSLNSSYFPDNAKVIFLDAGKMSYISTTSFARSTQSILIPSDKEEIKYDTEIKIHIGGIPSDLIDTSINNHTNFISMLGTILTRLNSKSIKYQIVDLNVGNAGNKYPTSLEITLAMNSYSATAFTAWLDGKIESFYKTFDEEDYPNAEYSYKLINEIEYDSDLVSAYTDATSSALTVLLYTLKNGNYRFNEDAVIPNGFEAGDVYAINCINQIRVSDEEGIVVGISTQAINKTYMSMIVGENKTAAKLSKCSFSKDEYIKGYSNDSTALMQTLEHTYHKVCDLSNASLNKGHDTYFTPMSYLNMINSKMDIVHIKLSSDTAKELTNMILCYIQTKGNLFSL